MNFKAKIINEILHFITPLRDSYKEEVDVISNDLLNNDYKSLESFVDKYFKNIFYSNEIKVLITLLVEKKILPDTYLELIKKNFKDYLSFTKINLSSKISIIESKPLNIKIDKLNIIKEIINKKEKETDQDVEKIKQNLIDAQLNYLKNANQFVLDLENKSEDEIYHSLLNLGDIRYIHHCISNLKTNTLKRFLVYMEKHLIENNNSIDIFIKEAIKLHIRNE